MKIFSTGIEIFAFIVGLIWLFFPFAVINFFSKQRGSLLKSYPAILYDLAGLLRSL